MDSTSKEIQNLTADDALSSPDEQPTPFDNIKEYGSVEEFDKNLPHTVTRLMTANGSVVYLVGTAHFSRESQDDVSLVIIKIFVSFQILKCFIAARR